MIYKRKCVLRYSRLACNTDIVAVQHTCIVYFLCLFHKKTLLWPLKLLLVHLGAKTQAMYAYMTKQMPVKMPIYQMKV